MCIRDSYKTVLLQFGLPEGSYPSLPALLARAQALPAAVENLLDPTHGDVGYRRLWEALKRCRTTSPRPTDLELVTTSPWIRPAAVDDLMAILRAAPPEAGAFVDESLPLETPYFDRDSLELVAVPRAFRPNAPLGGQTVVDLFVDGSRRRRYVVQKDKLEATTLDPIRLPCAPETRIELRFRDGTPAAPPWAMVLWDEDQPVVELATDDPRTTLLLVEGDIRPVVEPEAVSVQRFGDRWAILAQGPCTVRVEDEVVWRGGSAPSEAIDLRVSLLKPFEQNGEGELLVEVPAPWKLRKVSIERTPLACSALDTTESDFVAHGLVRDVPTGPNGIVRIVAEDASGTKTVSRRVPLLAGAWMRVAGTWERIPPNAPVDVAAIGGSRRLRFSVPGTGSSRTLLAGDWTLGRIGDGPAPLPRMPLAYGEPLVACFGNHGALPEDAARQSMCGSVVRRGIGTKLIERAGQWFLCLSEPWNIDPTRHRLVVWRVDGGVQSVPLDAVEGASELPLPGPVRAAALHVGGIRQAVAWTEDWSNGLVTEAIAHGALLVIRAFGLPLLAEPHRTLVSNVARAYPALTARTWLARDPLFGAPTDALTELLEDHDDGTEELWLGAIRQLLEPDWCTAYASKAMANRVLDELKRAALAEPQGDYKRAALRLFELGPRSTSGLYESVEQSTDAKRAALKRTIAEDLGLCSFRRRRGHPVGDSQLLDEARGALGATLSQFQSLLAKPPTDPAFRSAIHERAFRRVVLRALLLPSESPPAKPEPK